MKIMGTAAVPAPYRLKTGYRITIDVRVIPLYSGFSKIFKSALSQLLRALRYLSLLRLFELIFLPFLSMAHHFYW